MITDDACYYFINESCMRYVSVTPDGADDFTSLRANRNTMAVFVEDAPNHTIESVSKHKAAG